MTHDPTSPVLSYAGQSTRGAARPYHILIAVTSLVGFLAFTSAFCLIVPAFEGIYKDFKTELPGMTKMLLATARWYRDGGWGFAAVLCLAIPAAGVWLHSKAENDSSIKRYASLVVITAMALLLCCGTLMVMALLSPMMPCPASVSSPAKK